MFNLFLALRNLMRNRRRTLLALLAIVFGIIAMLLSEGFTTWIFWAMRESYIQSQLGHIQVTRPGYAEEGAADPFSYLLPVKSSIKQVIAEQAHVQVVAPRLNFNGFISFGDNTVSFTGQGVDVEKEQQVSKYVFISKGENLLPDMPESIILGKGLASNLGTKPGDKVVLLVTTPSGGLNATDAIVRGEFYTSVKAFDDVALRLPIATARKLVRVDSAHSWLVLLDETEQTEAVLKQLEGRSYADEELQFTPWFELSDFYNKTVELFSKQVLVVRVIIALIIVTSISNLLAMSVVERTGEIGTLMAIGQKRRNILWLFISEGIFLGMAGGIIGVILGFLLASIISSIGIPMPPPPGMDVGFTGEILLTPRLVVSAFMLGLITTVVASIYPAWKASRMEIVNALRHNR